MPVANKTTAKVANTSAHTPLPDALPVIAFADEAAWESWLLAHPDAPGLWLKIAKKTSGIASVDYAGALDVALCHGWIDGQKRGFDADYFLQRFTPRRSKSMWSKINIGHVERLIADGRMRAGGQREIDAANADGRWAAAYDGASRMEVPDALAAGLARNPKAAAFFETLNKTNRYAVCWRVQTAKTDATRASRVETLVAMLARGEKFHG
ncbi:MAG: YdeI/OmpD-associated family protein [Xanthomonadaceae bacterium]|nr:YdeI/OmpD-associated family protein [Xanthomonadaceae bacterium]